MHEPRFAALGGRPLFESLLPVGQLYFPSWERYEAAFRGIFAREYYNNNGPLHGQLERELADFLQVRHAICVSNATLGLMMVADALGLKGKVIVPAFTFIASAQALSWAGLEPVFCDVDPITHQIDHVKAETLIGPDVSAILGVNLWGGACNPAALVALGKRHGIPVFFDSAHAFGCSVGPTRIGNFGHAEVFSFHATKVLSAGEGGCICTNDDALAARLRGIRPSYGIAGGPAIERVANARLSEAQAAIALMSLEDFRANRWNNEVLHRYYAQRLRGIPGLTLLQPQGVSVSNFQYAVCMLDAQQFGLGRDRLVDILKAENIVARRYFFPGAHRTIPYRDTLPQYRDALPETDRIAAGCLQLPLGAQVTLDAIERIADLLGRIHQAAAQLTEEEVA